MKDSVAFSLVELSIVLVILGLLTGGILAGQSLIRAAELRAVSTEMNRYQGAINAFRDRYFALPGDMTNAYSFWGTALGCTNVTAISNAAGCNGDGNGQIYHNTSEMLRAWQMLASAGLIEGSYTGNYAAATTWTPGTHVPASKLGNAGWGISWYTPSVYEVWESTMPANWLQIGRTFASNLPIGAILKPEEAWNIETKMDDGMPALGTVIGGTTLGAANCTTGTGSTTAYLLTNSGTACGIAVRIN